MFMQIVVALLIVIGITFAAMSTDRENPQAVREARQELDNMRTFALSVARYTGSHADFEGTINWNGTDGALALRAQPTTPEGLRGIQMPEGWRAKVQDGDYVLCASLSEAATALFTAELSDGLHFGVERPQSSSSTNGYVVLGDADDRKVSQSTNESSTTTWARACDE